MIKRKSAMFAVFVFYGFGVIGSGIIAPLLYKSIIDIISAADGITASIERGVMLNVMFIAITAIFYNIFYRIGDWAIANFETDVMKKLMDFVFTKLNSHSYNFFTNTFTGSLVAKSQRFVRSFEKMFDIVAFTIWFGIIQLAGSFIVLFFSNVCI